jgi:hypothetical protein
LFSVVIVLVSSNLLAQQKPYYYNIPDTPKTYTAAAVAARLVDGLGFRYFWATEGLRDKDLAFRPSDSARSSFETLKHLFDLTLILMNTVSNKPTDFSNIKIPDSFAALREQTLQHIQKASEILKQSDANLENFDMVFKGSSGNESQFPFWNLINGPIADALWHTGQVVTFRRTSGNPIYEGVDVLRGTKN